MPDFDFATGCTDAQFEARIALLEIDVALLEINPNHAHVVRAEEVKDHDHEKGGDIFLKGELSLTAILAAAMKSKSDEVRPAVDAAIAKNDQRALGDALDKAGNAMSQVFTPEVEEKVRAEIEELISVGAEQEVGESTEALAKIGPSVAGHGIAEGTAIAGRHEVGTVADGMVRAAKYYSNRFFNDQVLPAIRAEVAKLNAEAGPTEVPSLGSIRPLIDARFKSVPYWRVVANAAASRAYHYGYLKNAQAIGHTEYEFQAVVDDKTTALCLFMNGKRFPVADAVKHIETIAQSDDPEVVKQLAPWRKLDDIQGLSDDELVAAGCFVPPLHGNCRSELAVVRT